MSERLTKYEDYNLIYVLGFEYDYDWRLRLHQHPLLNCKLPVEAHESIRSEASEDCPAPSILPIIRAFFLLENIEYPIAPVQTAEKLAGHFEEESEMYIAKNLYSQIPHLSYARYIHYLKSVSGV